MPYGPTVDVGLITALADWATCEDPDSVAVFDVVVVMLGANTLFSVPFAVCEIVCVIGAVPDPATIRLRASSTALPPVAFWMIVCTTGPTGRPVAELRASSVVLTAAALKMLGAVADVDCPRPTLVSGEADWATTADPVAEAAPLTPGPTMAVAVGLEIAVALWFTGAEAEIVASLVAIVVMTGAKVLVTDDVPVCVRVCVTGPAPVPDWPRTFDPVSVVADVTAFDTVDAPVADAT